jgi:ribosomal protein S18 acetylase RimI-like enzyme
VHETRDRDALRALLHHDVALHVYELGDLDDRYWPHTRWFASADASALLYTAVDPPVLVALGRNRAGLLAALATLLPPVLYAHLSPGLVDALAPRFRSVGSGRFLKMALTDATRVRAVEVAGTVVLGPGDEHELVAFYRDAYPTSSFDARMLEGDKFTAVRAGGRVVAVAGVHVCSASERVAAIGNVAVAPAFRGRGLATRVTAATCVRLFREVDLVGLNVKADNVAARTCYERLGFTDVAPYEEHQLVATDE